MLFPPYSVTLTFLADFVTTLMTVAFSVMSIPEKSNTASKTAKIAGGLTNISWSSSDAVEFMKGVFFSDIGEMIEL
ncbi:hypothetical protein T484DRAFT_1866776 [Baffinella frigidus]|nr:hypothetical protein T484DRAFT_1866776 [Cryptophyta sp. CCMP2293]